MSQNPIVLFQNLPLLQLRTFITKNSLKMSFVVSKEIRDAALSNISAIPSEDLPSDMVCTIKCMLVTGECESSFVEYCAEASAREHLADVIKGRLLQSRKSFSGSNAPASSLPVKEVTTEDLAPASVSSEDFVPLEESCASGSHTASTFRSADVVELRKQLERFEVQIQMLTNVNALQDTARFSKMIERESLLIAKSMFLIERHNKLQKTLVDIVHRRNQAIVACAWVRDTKGGQRTMLKELTDYQWPNRLLRFWKGYTIRLDNGYLPIVMFFEGLNAMKDLSEFQAAMVRIYRIDVSNPRDWIVNFNREEVLALARQFPDYGFNFQRDRIFNKIKFCMKRIFRVQPAASIDVDPLYDIKASAPIESVDKMNEEVDKETRQLVEYLINHDDHVPNLLKSPDGDAEAKEEKENIDTKEIDSHNEVCACVDEDGCDEHYAGQSKLGYSKISADDDEQHNADA